MEAQKHVYVGKERLAFVVVKVVGKVRVDLVLTQQFGLMHLRVIYEQLPGIC